MKRFFAPGIIFIVFHISHYEPVFANLEEPLPDVRSMSMGDIHALSHEFVNPAYLSFLENPQLGFAVHNHFQIQELNTVDAICLLPNKLLDAGMKISRYGYSDYSSLSGRLGFSKKLNPSIGLGCNISGAVESFAFEEKTDARINVDGGIFACLSEKIDLALLARNLVQDNENNSFLLHSGVNWNASSSCSLVLELASDFNGFFNLMSGIEYELIDKFYVRAGCQVNPKLPTFGMSYSLDHFTFDLCFRNHYALGVSSSLGFSYQF